MISYLGVSIDDLVQTLESAFVFTDDRDGRALDEPVSFDEEDDEALEVAEQDFDSEDDDFSDAEAAEVFVDDEGMLHAQGFSVTEAAERVIEYLTDYLVTDDMDLEWLTVDQTRGVLLALKVILPSLDEIPSVESGYRFTIERDRATGLPSNIAMQAVSLSDSDEEASLSFSADRYEGYVKDSTNLADLFTAAKVPAEDKEALSEVLSEAIFALSDEQCGVVLDVRAFVEALQGLRHPQTKRLSLVEDEPSELKH